MRFVWKIEPVKTAPNLTEYLPPIWGYKLQYFAFLYISTWLLHYIQKRTISLRRSSERRSDISNKIIKPKSEAKGFFLTPKMFPRRSCCQETVSRKYQYIKQINLSRHHSFFKNFSLGYSQIWVFPFRKFLGESGVI